MKTPIEHFPGAATATPLPVGVWRVDRRRSEVGFAVKDMWGLRTVRGVFHEYEGNLTVRADAVAGELTIDANSLDTGSNRRDQHLRSAAFFDVERNPRIVFTATDVTARNGRLAVMGELAIGSSRARLEIPVGLERMAGRALRIDGKTTVSRQSAGVAWNMLGMIRGDAILHARLIVERAVPEPRANGGAPPGHDG